jgi:uncharacterized damage-inducible protein DinB
MAEQSPDNSENPDIPTRWAASTEQAEPNIPTRWASATEPAEPAEPAEPDIPTRWASATAPAEPDIPTRWAAATAQPDMWVDPADDPRDAADAELTDEKSTLTEYLRGYRLTLEMKCADLNPQQLASRSVPPSPMSLLGLVRHMADVERGWFRRTMAGQDVPWIFRTDADRDAAWNGAVGDPKVVEAAWQAWHAEVTFAEQYLAAATDLGVHATTRTGQSVSLRVVVVHMIEEYARHCGHADLIRERIDGRVGQ